MLPRILKNKDDRKNSYLKKIVSHVPSLGQNAGRPTIGDGVWRFLSPL